MKIQKLIAPLKDYLWGGNKLKTEYGKNTDNDIVAESWELSFHKDGPTMIENGEFLKDAVCADDIGKNCQSFEFFPTLAKFIDAKDNLSVQVHPSDEYALKYENSYGKTEMWYIVEAEEGAGIYLGMKETVSAEEFEKAINENTLTSLLNFFHVKKGECYFIPSQTIHAIASGCLIYEIQQNSNLTYRVYDYNRKDKNGKSRELHVEKAKTVANLNKFVPISLNVKTDKGDLLGISKYFTASRLILNGNKMLSTYNSYCCITCLEGCALCDGISIRKGESLFIPANYGKYTLDGNATLILTEVRKYFLKETESKIEIVDDENNVIISKNSNENTAKSVLAMVNLTNNDLD